MIALGLAIGIFGCVLGQLLAFLAFELADTIIHRVRYGLWLRAQWRAVNQTPPSWWTLMVDP